MATSAELSRRQHIVVLASLVVGLAGSAAMISVDRGEWCGPVGVKGEGLLLTLILYFVARICLSPLGWKDR